MRDMLDTGMTWLREQRVAHMARTVTYTRANDSVELAASIGRTIFRSLDEYGIEVRFVTRDYLITTADLILAGSAVEPQDGDKITVGDYMYEVMKPETGEPSWRYADAYRGTLRVHTKEIKA